MSDRDGMVGVLPGPRRDKPLCGARRRQGGEPCRRPAGWGTSHVGIGACKLHGGATPNGAKYAQRVAADRAVVTYGLPREVDPWQALLEEVHRTAGHVEWLGFQVAQQSVDAVGGGSVWVDLYQGERRHLVAVSKAAMDCGVAERQVRLAEQQGLLLVTVIRGVLGDLGVLDDPRVAGIVQRHLATVSEATAVEA